MTTRPRMARLREILGKHWFVAGLAVAVLLGCLVPGPGGEGGWLRASDASKAGVALIFLTQGLVLPVAALRRGALAWRLHVLVQGFGFVVMPLMGLAVDAVAGAWMPADVRLGFLYLCVLPTTVSTAIVLTTVAGGNAAGAVFNATLSSVLGVVVTPAWAGWLMQTGGQAQPLGPVIREIVVLLVVPLVAGFVLRRWVGAWAEARRKALANLSSGIILFIVYAAFARSVEAGVWERHGAGVVVPVAAGVAGLLAVAPALAAGAAAVLRLDRADRIAALFCAPQKTLASGGPMAAVIFAGRPELGLILLPLLMYHPLQLLVGGVMASRLAAAGSGERARGGART